MSIVHQTELVEGTKYRVRWKQQSGNGRWYMKEATWVYIGKSNAQYGPDQLIWSGRPVCGTQDMDVTSFVDAQTVPKDVRCTVPRSLGEVKKDA